MSFYLYLQDTFKPLDLSWGEVAPLEPLQLFELLRREVEEVLGTVKSVHHYATFTGPSGLVVEYLVEYECGLSTGTASVKLIYGESPAKALAEYYERERSRARVKWDDYR